jgi:hypothetical protein
VTAILTVGRLLFLSSRFASPEKKSPPFGKATGNLSGMLKIQFIHNTAE